MSKRHADSTADEKAPKRRKLSADEVLVEAARNGDTTAVRVGLEKLSPDTDSKTVSFDAVHEACRGNHDEYLALLLPYVETTQMGFGMLLSECIHADHTACTEVLLQHWKSVCSNVAFVPLQLKDKSKGKTFYSKAWTLCPCPVMWEDPAVCQVLIDAGADIEAKDEYGRSPLLMASREGYLAVVKMLVKAGAGVCVTDNEGNTCLVLAAHQGHMETVRYLVGLKDVDVNDKPTSRGDTAVLAVAEENHADVMEVLIDAGADIGKNYWGRSPLNWACFSGALAVVKLLVKAGASVTDEEGYAWIHQGDTCLAIAAQHGHTETVRYLVGLPEVDVNLKGEHGTAVHVAAYDNHADVMEVLIDAGADIEVKNESGHNAGRSPLLVASQRGNLRVVEVLVRAGAGVCVTDNGGETCLTRAAACGHTETVRTLLCMPEVDENQSNSWYCTSLHLAATRKHSDVVQVLIDAGADVEAKNDMGCSPLYFACEAGKLETVKMLVEAGADVCVVDGNGIPGLLIAAAGGHTETVRYLVGLRGVDVNHRDIAGFTALKHARLNGCAAVEKVLLKHGAEQ